MYVEWMLTYALLGLIFLRVSAEPTSWPRTIVKTIPLLVLMGLSFVAKLPPILTLALAIFAVGDFALSRPGQRAFMIGLIAFAVGQFLYVLLFADLVGLNASPFLAYIGMLALAASTVFWLLPYVGNLRVQVLAYILVISIMASISAGFWSVEPLVTLGALLFVFSDIVLAIELFRLGVDHPLRSLLVWVMWTSYLCAQALIVLGLLEVLSRTSIP